MAPGLVQPAEQASANGIEDLLPSDEDLLYEEELLRNPYSLKMWCVQQPGQTYAAGRAIFSC